MSLRYRARSTGAALIVIATHTAIPVPARNLPDLVHRADLIVTGAISSLVPQGFTVVTTQGHPVPARSMSAELEIDHVLKGPAELTRVAVEFVVPDAHIGYGEVVSSQYRVFFLTRTEDGYMFVSPYYPSVIAARTTLPTGATPLDRVAAIVGAVLHEPRARPEQKRQAISALRGLRTAVAVTALRRGLADRDRGVQLASAAALLAVGDLTALAMAEVELSRPAPVPSPEHVQNLRSAISLGVSDESAIPSLSRLASSPDAATRRAAAAALMRTKSMSAVPALARALNDADVEVRYYAVVGLAEILGDLEWRPNMDMFLADQARFLDYWRARVPR